MSRGDPWRKIPAAGEWSREDAGRSGIECASCGADSGYLHRCVACGRLDLGDAGRDESSLSDPGHKPHRFLAACIQHSQPLARLREWLRGIRRVDRADAWLTAADDLSQALPDGVLAALIERRVAVDDQLPDGALDSIDGVREVLSIEVERDEPRRTVVGHLNERVQQLRAGHQTRDGPAESDGSRTATDATEDRHATAATDGGVGLQCPHDPGDRRRDCIDGDHVLWCGECQDFVARLDEDGEIVEALDIEAVGRGGSD